VIPSIILAGVNAYRLWTEHWEHVAHGPALEDKPEYPFQNIRTKNYFWGDGDKVRTFDINGTTQILSFCHSEVLTPLAQTLFWNPKVNYHKKE
jgi:cytochrome c oxidase subunit 6a